MLSNKRGRSLSILGVSSGLGQRHLGVETTPQILREQGLIQALSVGVSSISDLGDITPLESENFSFWELMKRLRLQAFEVLKKGDLLVTLGGDHSLAIATVQASLLANPETRVVWVDAHGDINTPTTSITGNLHGMPLAALLGLFETPIAGPRLRPQNLLFVGVRELDPAEIGFIKELEISVISADEAVSQPESTLEKINAWLSRSPEAPIHLSFDIDALDPELAPATGIRVTSGLSMNFSKSLVQMISQTRQLNSIDFVELNPLKADTSAELEQSIAVAKEILVHAISPQGMQ